MVSRKDLYYFLYFLTLEQKTRVSVEIPTEVTHDVIVSSNQLMSVIRVHGIDSHLWFGRLSHGDS